MAGRFSDKTSPVLKSKDGLNYLFLIAARSNSSSASSICSFMSHKPAKLLTDENIPPKKKKLKT